MKNNNYIVAIMSFLLMLISANAYAIPITVEVNWPNWSSENRVRIFDGATVLQHTGAAPTDQICDPVNCYTGGSDSVHTNTYTYDIPPGTYNIRMDDSYGDGWNGVSTVRILNGSTLILQDDGPATFTETLSFDIPAPSGPPAPSNGTLNYPNSGNGSYHGSIALLDWAGSGLDDGIRDGDSVSFGLNGCRTGTLNATFSNIVDPAAAQTYQPTDMNTWSGSSMWQAYNGPGTGEALYGADGAKTTFRINWSMDLDGVPVIPDIFVLDAEATNGGGELISATTTGGNWGLVDSAGGTGYTVSGIGSQTFTITQSESPSNSPMLVSMNSSQMDVTIEGGGRQAIAFGILESCDYGDADGYASAAHAFDQEPASPSGLQFVAGQLYLGSSTSTPDADKGQQDNATATGDDTDTQGDDEGGISTFPSLGVGQSSYTIPAANITASGSGTLYAWIDFNSNGVFDANEYASATLSSGSLSGNLVFSGYTAPATVGTTFARFRLTTDTLTSADAAGNARDGEVEDYQITISANTTPDISLLKTVTTIQDPLNGFLNPKAIPGALLEYRIKATNSGATAADDNSIIISDTIPANTALYVNDISGPGSGPIRFVDGSLPNQPSGLDMGVVSYFNSSGTSITTLSPDSDGVDTSVASIRVSTTGPFLAPSGSGDPSFTLLFRVKVQ